MATTDSQLAFRHPPPSTAHPPSSNSNTANNPSSSSTSAQTLTPLEQEVLDEYARLLGNLNTLSALLADLAADPSAEILEGLRGLERRTSLVFTLLKASVYSIVLQQQIFGEGDGVGGEG